MTGQVNGAATYTRTFIGAKDHINTSIKGQGDEFGVGWRHAEVDRIYFDNGFSGRFTRAGLSPESGLSLIRGDNSSAFYASTINNPNSITFVDPVAPADAPWHEVTNEYFYADKGTSASEGEDFPRINWALNVTPKTPFQVFVEWTPDFDRASSAKYEVKNAVPLGQYGRTVFQVDQRNTPADFELNGKRWRSLGWFKQASSLEAVELELTAINADLLTVAGQAFVAEDFSYETPAESIGSTLEWSTTTIPVHRYAGNNEEQLGTAYVLKTRNGQEYAFTSGGLHVATFDRHGNQTRFVYADTGGDAWDDELTRIIRQGGLETEYRYDGNGYLSSVVDFRVDGDGNPLETRYSIVSSPESGGLLQRITLPDTGFAESQSPVFEFGYAFNGLVDQVSQAKGAEGLSTEIQYRTWDTNRAASVTQLGSEGQSRTTQFTSVIEDAFYNTRVAGSNDLDQPVAPLVLAQASATVTDARANTWTYQTDNFGLVTAVQKPELAGQQSGLVWKTFRDSLGRVTLLEEPEVTTTEFDAAGLPSRSSTPVTRKTKYIYSSVHENLESIVYAEGSGNELVESWTWVEHDVNGFRFWAIDEHTATDSVVTKYDYQGKSSPQVIIENFGGGAGEPVRATTMTYTPSIGDYTTTGDRIFLISGGLSKSMQIGNQTTSFNYYGESGPDPRIGLLRDETVSGGSLSQTTAYDYDANRNLVKTVAPGNVETNFEYDNLGQLIATIYPAQSYYAVDENNQVNLANPAEDRSIRKRDVSHYDAVGNLVKFVEHRDNPAAANYSLSDSTTGYFVETVYIYDGFNQLTNVKHPLGQSVSTALNPIDEYVYDANGNLISEIFHVDGQQRTTGHEYDAWNRKVKTEGHTPTFAAGVTAPDESLQQAVVTYRYDASDNLIHESDPRYGTQADPTGNAYFFDIHGRLVATTIMNEGGAIADAAPVQKFEHDDAGRVRFVHTRMETLDENASQGNSFVTQVEFATVENIYDELGRIEYEISPGSNSLAPSATHHQYDARDNVKSTQFGQWFGSNTFNALTTESYFHDGLDRLIAANHVDFSDTQKGLITLHSYDEYGNLATTLQRPELATDTDAFLAISRSSTDLLNESKTQTAADIDVRLTRNIYDRVGNVILTILPDANGESEASNNFGADDYSPYIVEHHDLNGNVVQSTTLFRDSNNTSVWSTLTTNIQFDNLGRIWQSQGPVDDDGIRTQTIRTYNSDGSLATTQDRNWSEDNGFSYITTKYEHDSLGRQYSNATYQSKARDVHSDNRLEIAYKFSDANGNTIQTIDRRGDQTDFLYDGYNRLYRINRDLPGGFNSTHLLHTPQGQQKLQYGDSSFETVEYYWNNLGQLALQTNEDVAGEKTKITKYTYDSLGNQRFLHVTHAHVPTNLNEDPENDFRKFSQLVAFERYDNGLIKSELQTTWATYLEDLNNPNDVQKSYSYDAFGNLVSRIIGSETVSYETNSVGLVTKESWSGTQNKVTDLEYTSLGETRAVSGSDSNGTIGSFEIYYGADRKRTLSKNEITGWTTFQFEYENDRLGLGNTTKYREVDSEIPNSVLFSHSTEYDAIGRLVQIVTNGSPIQGTRVTLDYAQEWVPTHAKAIENQKIDYFVDNGSTIPVASSNHKFDSAGRIITEEFVDSRKEYLYLSHGLPQSVTHLRNSDDSTISSSTFTNESYTRPAELNTFIGGFGRNYSTPVQYNSNDDRKNHEFSFQFDEAGRVIEKKEYLTRYSNFLTNQTTDNLQIKLPLDTFIGEVNYPTYKFEIEIDLTKEKNATLVEMLSQSSIRVELSAMVGLEERLDGIGYIEPSEVLFAPSENTAELIFEIDVVPKDLDEVLQHHLKFFADDENSDEIVIPVDAAFVEIAPVTSHTYYKWGANDQLLSVEFRRILEIESEEGQIPKYSGENAFFDYDVLGQLYRSRMDTAEYVYDGGWQEVSGTKNFVYDHQYLFENGIKRAVFHRSEGEQVSSLHSVITTEGNRRTFSTEFVNVTENGPRQRFHIFDHEGKTIELVDVDGDAEVVLYQKDGVAIQSTKTWHGYGSFFAGFVSLDYENALFFRNGRIFDGSSQRFITENPGASLAGSTNLYQRESIAPTGSIRPSYQNAAHHYSSWQVFYENASPTFFNMLQVIGGIGQALAGLGTSPFGGLVLIGRGIDDIQAGLRSLWSPYNDPPVRTGTYHFAKSISMGNETFANTVDISTGILGPASAATIVARTSAVTKTVANTTRVGQHVTKTVGEFGYLFKHGTRAAFQEGGAFGAVNKFRNNFGQWRRGETVTCFVAGTPLLVSAEQHEKYHLAEMSSDMLATTLSGNADKSTLGFTITGLGVIGWGLIQYQRSKLKKVDVQQLRRKQKEIDRLIYEEFSLGWVN